MNKKLTGLTASGQTQPEIRIGDTWKDGYGCPVTVKSAVFNRVIFIREGYEHPCTFPKDRFTREFRLVRREENQ